MSELQFELESSRDREVKVHQQLSEAIKRAEKTKIEKDTLAKMVRHMSSQNVLTIMLPVSG